MSAKGANVSSASLKRLEEAKQRKKAIQFDRIVRQQLRRVMAAPPGTMSMLVVVTILDKTGEFVQIIHNGPPGPPAFLVGGLQARQF